MDFIQINIVRGNAVVLFHLRVTIV